MEQPPAQYIPGVCNIGPAEIRLRKRLGWWGVLITIIVWALLVWLQLPVTWRIIIFLPVFFSANGFLQGFMHFCAGFGMKGVFNFGPAVGKTDTVSQAEFRKKDRRKAQQIFIYATLIGIAVVLVALWL
jgi:accessory gene regulator protein AgrB